MITSKKKSKKLKQEQKTTQKVEQKVNIRIGELPAKKKSRKRRQKKTVEVSRQPPTQPSFTPPQTLYPYRPSSMFVQQPPQYQPPPFSSRELTTFLQPLEERLKGIEKSIAQRPFNILRSEQRLGRPVESETSSELSLGSEEYPLIHPIQNFLPQHVGGYTPQNFQYNIPPPPNNPSFFDIPQAFHTPIIQRPSSVSSVGTGSEQIINRPFFATEETESELGWGSAYFGTEPSSPVPRSEEEREIQRDNQAYLQLTEPEIQERERERPTSGILAHQPQIQHTPQYTQEIDYPNEEYNEEEVETNVEKEKGGGGDPFGEWLRNSSNISSEVNNRPKVGYSDSLDTRSNVESIISSERGEHRVLPNLSEQLNREQGITSGEKLVNTINEVVSKEVEKSRQKEKEERTARLLEESPEEIEKEKEQERKREERRKKEEEERRQKEEERDKLILEARRYGINVGRSGNDTIRKKIEEAKQKSGEKKNFKFLTEKELADIKKELKLEKEQGIPAKPYEGPEVWQKQVESIDWKALAEQERQKFEERRKQNKPMTKEEQRYKTMMDLEKSFQESLKK